MKRPGIVGGIAPESTIEYYRQTVALFRERAGDGSYPSIVIVSIDLKRMLDLIAARRLTELTDYLLGEIHRLHRAGADFAALASNTPHVVFEPLERQSPVPLVSIVDVTVRAARDRGLRRVGLIGTRFTMQGRFYPDALARAGIAVALPSEAEQAYVHDKYMSELVKGDFRPDTRAGLLGIVQALRSREGIDGLILGGTELPFILGGDVDAGIPMLDTTRLHVEEIVSRIFS
jgi:aspartate racemase